jgi:hypothetical protein
VEIIRVKNRKFMGAAAELANIRMRLIDDLLKGEGRERGDLSELTTRKHAGVGWEKNELRPKLALRVVTKNAQSAKPETGAKKSDAHALSPAYRHKNTNLDQGIFTANCPTCREGFSI